MADDSGNQSSPGEMRPLRDFQYNMSPSPLSSPLPDQSPDLAHLSRSISNNTLSSSAILSASMDGIGAGSPSATLTFEGLKVAVKLKGGFRSVLDGISGYAEPGQLLAIMGPPRSGKSTLLNTLAGKLTRNAVYEGEILLNGRRQQLTYGTAANVSKEDVLMGTLTVQETMYLSALLRLPESVSHAEKIAMADSTMQEMGLMECAAVRVGSSFYQSGLTRAEKRRLTIALELLTRPHLLYLDDPIDGLDSASAVCLVARLKCMAMDAGRTLIIVFPNVSADCFELIDNVCLLTKGRLIFFGESSLCTEHLTRSGYPCPPGYNASEHFLRTLDPTYDHMKVMSTSSSFIQDPARKEMLLREQAAQVVRSLASFFAHSPLATKAMTRRKELAKKKGAVLVSSCRHADFKQQLVVLSYRSILNRARDLSYFWYRLGISTLLMIMVGTIFSRLGKNSQGSIQERFSCLFVVLQSMMLVAMIGGSSFHFRELQIYFRERMNPHYGALVFVLGTTVASVPFIFIISAVTSAVVYFIPSLDTGFEQFAYFTLCLFASLATVESIMLALSVVALSPYGSLSFGLAIQVVYTLVAGYFRLLEDLPTAVWRFPFSYISFHTYALRGMAVNEFHGSKFANSQLPQNGNVVESFYGTEHQSKWRDLGILLGMAVFYRILFYYFILAHNYLQPFVRLWKIQHGNFIHRRPTSKINARNESMAHSTVSKDSNRFDRSKEDLEFGALQL